MLAPAWLLRSDWAWLIWLAWDCFLYNSNCHSISFIYYLSNYASSNYFNFSDFYYY